MIPLQQTEDEPTQQVPLAEQLAFVGRHIQWLTDIALYRGHLEESVRQDLRVYRAIEQSLRRIEGVSR